MGQTYIKSRIQQNSGTGAGFTKQLRIMQYLQRIYFNDKPLVLTTDGDEFQSNNAGSKGFQIFSGANIRNFNLALHQMENPGTLGCIIEDSSVVALQECLQNLYTPIDAGGGLVFNDAGALLMIFRRGKWDLPKGKLDPGETMEECALREVSEETGVRGLTATGKLIDTYHIYMMHDELMLKRTAWYRMMSSSTEKLRPQKEEQIMEAKWVSLAELPTLAAKSYEAIREVLRAAGLI